MTSGCVNDVVVVVFVCVQSISCRQLCDCACEWRAVGSGPSAGDRLQSGAAALRPRRRTGRQLLTTLPYLTPEHLPEYI